MIKLDASGMMLRELNQKLRKLLEAGEEVEVHELPPIHGVGAGLDEGKVSVQGDVGDYFGMLNSGCQFEVHGSAGRYLGDGGTNGTIHVHGDADIGAAEYCYGGKVIIDGSAGDFLGTMNKGATVVVGRDVGDDVGTYMVAGDIVILGSAGERLGNYIIRGAIYIAGEHGELGNNTKEERLRSEDIDKIGKLLRERGSLLNPRSFKKIVPLSPKPFYRNKGESK